MSKSEQQFIQAICEHLDRSLNEIEPAMGTRLDAVRKAALLRESAADEALEEKLFTDSLLSALEDQHAPAYVEKRLDAIRTQALGRLDLSTAAPRQPLWRDWMEQIFGGGFRLTASMVATACVLLTVVSLVYVRSDSGGNLTLDDELILVASAEDLELYENLDFYMWLDENGFAN